MAIVASFLLPISACDRDQPDVRAVRKIFGASGTGQGEFSYPRGIAVSPVDGCVYVVDKTARIQRFSPDGDFQCIWQMPEWERGKPTGLSVDKQNRVWVPDTHYARVWAFDRDGHELLRFGSLGRGPGQFIFPTCVAIDRDGIIYVGEYGDNDRISKFTPDGRYLSSFADPDSGDAAVQRPTEMVFDENDVLWVADACHHRVCRFSRDGKLLSQIPLAGLDEISLNYPYGLFLEPGGTFVIADHGNNRIVRYAREGKQVATWGSPGRGPGQIIQPWDTARGLDGRIYVLDSWNNRVQMINW